MISGHATPTGTAEFATNSDANSENYNKFVDLTLSNVGIGTYLGDADSDTDKRVVDAVKTSVSSGVNVIDTAINYRAQKAERSVGTAIAELVSEQKASRDQIFVCTKNGYVTNDADVPLGFWEYVKQEYTQKGVVNAGDITSGYHCMTPKYLSDQLERSLQNLGLDCIDLLYLHNAVEGQIQDVPMSKFLENLEAVIEMYEQKRREGKIQFYGLATWECFRVPSNNSQHLSLETVIKMAKDANGGKMGGEDDHGLRFIQLPYNLHYGQALLEKTQDIGGTPVSVLEAASRLNIGVFTSVPFMQGKLLQEGAMPAFLNDLDTSSLRAMQFVRSTPGVLAPLIGQKSPEHVSENLKIMKVPPVLPDQFSKIVQSLIS